MRRRLYKFQFTICCSVLAHAHTLSQCRVTFLTHEQTQPTRKQTILPCTAQLSFARLCQFLHKYFPKFLAFMVLLYFGCTCGVELHISMVIFVSLSIAMSTIDYFLSRVSEQVTELVRFAKSRFQQFNLKYGHILLVFGEKLM